MTARLSFTQAAVRRAIAAAKKAGLRVVGIRPDGIVIVDDGENGHPLLSAALAVGEAPGSSEWEDVEA